MEVRMGALRTHHNSEELMVSQHLGRGWEKRMREVVLSQRDGPQSSPLSPALPPVPSEAWAQSLLLPSPPHPTQGICPKGWQPGGGGRVTAHP